MKLMESIRMNFASLRLRPDQERTRGQAKPLPAWMELISFSSGREGRSPGNWTVALLLHYITEKSILWLTTRACWNTKLSLAMGLKLWPWYSKVFTYILKRQFYLWSQLSSLRYMMHKLFWIVTIISIIKYNYLHKKNWFQK